MHALIVDCVSHTYDENINSQALQHEETMWGIHSKMETNSFRSQLQAVRVLTTFYEDIKEVHGACGCTKPKAVKRPFQDADEAGTPEDDTEAAPVDAADAAPAAAAEATPAAAALEDPPAAEEPRAAAPASAAAAVLPPAQPERRREGARGGKGTKQG